MTSCVCNCAACPFRTDAPICYFHNWFYYTTSFCKCQMVFVAKSIFLHFFVKNLSKSRAYLLFRHHDVARFDADIAVISAVFAVQSPGNLLVGLDDDAVGLERIDDVLLISRDAMISFSSSGFFGRLIRVTSKSPSSRRTSCPGRFLKPPTDLAFVTIP